MNTLISIVMAIVLNFLGFEVEDRVLTQTAHIIPATTQDCAMRLEATSTIVYPDSSENINYILHHQSESNINVN